MTGPRLPTRQGAPQLWAIHCQSAGRRGPLILSEPWLWRAAVHVLIHTQTNTQISAQPAYRGHCGVLERIIVYYTGHERLHPVEPRSIYKQQKKKKWLSRISGLLLTLLFSDNDLNISGNFSNTKKKVFDFSFLLLRSVTYVWLTTRN